MVSVPGSPVDPVEVRRVHRPVQAPCGCSRWICSADDMLWPCQVEYGLRLAGVRPHTIDDYLTGVV